MSSFICSFARYFLYSVFNEHCKHRFAMFALRIPLGLNDLAASGRNSYRFVVPPFWLPDWLAQVDSNHRPRAYQARALTT